MRSFLGGTWWHEEFDALPDVAPVMPQLASDVGSLFDEEHDEAFDAMLNDDVLVTATDIAMRVARRLRPGRARDPHPLRQTSCVEIRANR